jgi:hypothetical protein
MAHPLEWDETEFISMLEVFPTIDEYEEGRHFEVNKEGLRLLLSVYPFTSDFAISIFSDDEHPTISMHVNDCGGARHVKDIHDEYLEFAPSQIDHPDDLGRIPLGIHTTFCIRLRVKPRIALEFVRPI